MTLLTPIPSDLFMAAGMGQLDEVRSLLAKNTPYEPRAIHVAARRGHLSIVQLLLEHGQCSQDDLDCALRNAAAEGWVDVVSCLLDASAEVQSKDSSPLFYAAEYGHLEVVKILVKHGGHLHPGASKALLVSAMRGYSTIVEYLLEIGCDTVLLYEKIDEAEHLRQLGFKDPRDTLRVFGSLEIDQMVLGRRGRARENEILRQECLSLGQDGTALPYPLELEQRKKRI